MFLLKKNEQALSFWKSRKGILLQIVVVLLPSAIFLKSGNLLLMGVLFNVALSWIGLKFQQLNWSDVGLKRSSNLKKVFLIVLVAIVILIPVAYILRHIITSLTDMEPDLEAFKALEGNLSSLAIGLVIVWIFAAFGEEMLFRGFLMNTFYKLFPDYFNDSMKWFLSLLVTSVLVGFGHTYQGITGMILTGLTGFCFGLIYLYSKQNLWPCILTHGLYDTIAFIMVYSGFNLDQLF